MVINKEKFKNRSLFIIVSLFEDGRSSFKLIEAGTANNDYFEIRFINAYNLCHRFNEPIGYLFERLTGPLDLTKNPYEIIDQEIYETDIKPNVSTQELDLFIDFYKTLPKDIDENNLPVDFWMDVYEVTSATHYPEKEC